MRDLLSRRAGFVDARKMLHRIDNHGSNTIMIAFDEVDTGLGTFWEEDVVVAIEKVDAGNVTVVG